LSYVILTKKSNYLIHPIFVSLFISPLLIIIYLATNYYLTGYITGLRNAPIPEKINLYLSFYNIIHFQSILQ